MNFHKTASLVSDNITCLPRQPLVLLQ